MVIVHTTNYAPSVRREIFPDVVLLFVLMDGAMLFRLAAYKQDQINKVHTA